MQTNSVGFIQVLRNGRFRRLWLGQVVSAVGDYFYFLAVPILINRLTGSTAAIGAAMISSFALPQLLLGIPAGVMVDRWDRRRTMMAADLARAVLVLGGLLVGGAETVWILYIVGFLVSAASRFFYPAQSALIPVLVAEDELMAANGLSQLTMTAALLIGPALAGFMIAWLGAGVAFIIDSASFVVSALAIWSIGHVASGVARAQAAQTARALWGELIEGLRFLLNSPVLRWLMIALVMVHLGLGAINVLWVPLMTRRFGIGPEGIGLVDSIQGVGMALGGLAVGWLASRFSKIPILVAGTLIIGVMLALTGIAPAYIFILALTLILGLALSPVEAAFATMIQEATPDEKRGRASGAINTFSQVSGLVSMGLAAGMADWVGIPAVFVACGICVMLGSVGFAFLQQSPTRAVPAAGLPRASKGFEPPSA